MAEKVTIQTLHEMKRQRQRIAAAVVYEAQMAQIMDRAGADVLSVGDSVSRTFLGIEDESEFTVEKMAPFCRAVARAAKRALVNCDMPGSAVNAGPKAAAEAARRLAGEGAEMVKVDIREDMDRLFPVVLGVIDSGVVPVYPQIGFTAWWERHGGDDVVDLITAKAKALEDAGAVMIDLTAVTAEVYEAASKAVRIPVIGGQSGPEADGKIYVSYSLVGYQAALLDKEDGGQTAARFIFDIGNKAIANVHAGTFAS
ncbi:MAG TPA: 3-methyl-2-oxobutanoate hydroxymethyltransferase [Chloroflexota bacterium]|nr:3-methyl-2-oxobutanoate hydroxymethyltransferase [Chloroflexota bacterium]